MKFFRKKKSKAKHNLKGRVQCNENCVLSIPSKGLEFKGLIRELNWLGFIVDHIDECHRESLKSIDQDELLLHFKLPREFGSLEVKINHVIVSEYTETVDGTLKLRVEVNLEGHPELESIREFVSYRNRRFSRHHSSRRSLKLLKGQFILKWFFFLPSLFFILFVLVSYLLGS